MATPSYLGAFWHSFKKNGIANNERGNNLLDGGAHFYRTY